MNHVSNVFRKIVSYGPGRSLEFLLWHMRLFFRRHLHSSYSQSWEDIIVDHLLGDRESGFYVDVGAGHPVIGNNTMRFYRRGWSGINIEPNPDSFAKLEKCRPDDTNLRIGAGAESAFMEYRHFQAGNMSTFSLLEARLSMMEGYKLEDTRVVEVRSLADILEEHAGGSRIDFMSVDTEGWDLEVLAGNDWSRWSPSVICVETATRHMSDGSGKFNPAVAVLLESLGYHKVCATSFNSIFALAAGKETGIG